MRFTKNTPTITTTKVREAAAFWQDVMGLKITFDCGYHVGLSSSKLELAFMQPEGDQPTLSGGLMMCLATDNVDEEHQRLVDYGLEVVRPLQDNPWGDRSFSVLDPAGVTVYVYSEIEPSPEFLQHFK